ncbi:MAG: hypothetical protein RMM53_01380 [Bacteroidia bacterium]|nr:hypothetical protein [Bacteroidia bacterium]
MTAIGRLNAFAQQRDTIDAHYTVCASSVQTPTLLPGLGYRAGTHAPINVNVPGTGNVNAYVREHGIRFQVPDDGVVRKMAGVYVWFSPATRQVGAADVFNVKLYIEFGGAYYLLYQQPFTLEQVLESGNPLHGHTNPYQFPGNYIAFSAEQNVAGTMLVSIETKTAISNDTIAFRYTPAGCGVHNWMVVAHRASNHQQVWTTTYNQFYGDNQGNPVILPLIVVSGCVGLQATADIQNVRCHGENNGSIANIAVTGGTPPYTTEVFDGQGLLVPPSQYSSLAPAEYMLVVRDAAGCVLEQNFEISQPQPLAVEAQSVPATPGNADGQIIVAATGGNLPYAYRLNNGPIQSNNVFTGIAPGLYLITVTDSKGCVQTAEALVSESSIDVWPGDANNDGTVDVYDYFFTAGAYGLNGPARSVQGTLWQAYSTGQPWPSNSNFQGNIVNNVYLDANGDGIVNLMDVAATIVNRGLSR